MTDKDDIAALKAEVAALKDALSGKEDKPPKSTFVPMSDAEHRDMVHQMRERAASIIPPWMREACAGGVSDADAAGIRESARAPTGRPGMIPNSQPSGGGSSEPVNKTGWRDATPLGPQPGIDLIDRGVNAALPHGPEWGKK